MVAITDGSASGGRFRAAGGISAVAVAGGDGIGVREAEVHSGELTLRMFALMGGYEEAGSRHVALDRRPGRAQTAEAWGLNRNSRWRTRWPGRLSSS
jgi:hypothetical protein